MVSMISELSTFSMLFSTGYSRLFHGFLRIMWIDMWITFFKKSFPFGVARSEIMDFFGKYVFRL